MAPPPPASPMRYIQVEEGEKKGVGEEPNHMATLKAVPIPVLVEGDKYYCKCEKMCQNCTQYTPKRVNTKQYIMAQLMVLLTV